nr:HNH endonuclease family protein [Paraburkholderia sp. BL8N3]
MVYRKAKPQGTLLKEFKEHVTQATTPQTFVDTVLLPMAQALAALSGADYASTQHAELVNEHLRWLNKLEFKDWLPPALAFYVRHAEQPATMLAFFRDLERLAYSMLARKTGVNGRVERFSALTAAIENGQNLFAEASPLQLSPSEQYDTYSVLNGPLYDTHSARAVALLLLRLDRLLSDGSAVYEHDVVSVEHVMPQQPAPNSQWATWVPDTKIYQSWVHRLGNLVLLSRKKNSSAIRTRCSQFSVCTRTRRTMASKGSWRCATTRERRSRLSSSCFRRRLRKRRECSRTLPSRWAPKSTRVIWPKPLCVRTCPACTQSISRPCRRLARRLVRRITSRRTSLICPRFSRSEALRSSTEACSLVDKTKRSSTMCSITRSSRSAFPNRGGNRTKRYSTTSTSGIAFNASATCSSRRRSMPRNGSLRSTVALSASTRIRARAIRDGFPCA